MDDKSEESVIVRPPVGAGCNNVTVPVDAVPPLIGLALSWIEAGPEPQPRKLLVLVETLYREAVIVPVRFVSDLSVLTWNVAANEPTGTTTVAGTWIFGFPEVSLIVAPAALAGAARVRV